MRKMLLLLPIWLVLLMGKSPGSQTTGKMDSLRLLAGKLSDTASINNLVRLGKEFVRSIPDSVLKTGDQLILASEKIGYEKGIGEGWFLKASAYNNKSLFAYVIETGKKAISHFERSGDTSRLVAAMNMTVIAYEFSGLHELSGKMVWRALELAETIRDSVGIANSWLSLGHVVGNTHLGDDPYIKWKKSLEYYGNGLAIAKKLNNKQLLQRAYGLMANIYLFSGQHSMNNNDSLMKALDYYGRAIKISEETGDIRGQVSPLNNSIFIYQLLGQEKQVEKMIYEMYEKANASGSAYALSFANAAMADLYKEKGDITKEIKHLELSLEYGKQSSIHVVIITSLRALCEYYKKTGNHKRANDYLEELTKEIIDQNNRSNPLDLIRLHAESEHQREELIQKMQIENERAVSASESKRKNIILVSVGFVLILLLIFSLMLFKRYKVTNTQKNIIEEQKAILEEKQKEILDSMRYAKRIQESLLPSYKFIEKHLRQAP